jgi:hypothetical protein
MNNTEELLAEMKDWLNLYVHDQVTIAQCFRRANELEKWRVDMFYTTFAPYMANILDDYKVTKRKIDDCQSEYRRTNCTTGGLHENTQNACGGDMGMCMKCGANIKYKNFTWFSK